MEGVIASFHISQDRKNLFMYLENLHDIIDCTFLFILVQHIKTKILNENMKMKFIKQNLCGILNVESIYCFSLGFFYFSML